VQIGGAACPRVHYHFHSTLRSWRASHCSGKLLVQILSPMQPTELSTCDLNFLFDCAHEISLQPQHARHATQLSRPSTLGTSSARSGLTNRQLATSTLVLGAVASIHRNHARLGTLVTSASLADISCSTTSTCTPRYRIPQHSSPSKHS